MRPNKKLLEKTQPTHPWFLSDECSTSLSLRQRSSRHMLPLSHCWNDVDGQVDGLIKPREKKILSKNVDGQEDGLINLREGKY